VVKVVIDSSRAAAASVTKVWGRGGNKLQSPNFPTYSCKFPTEEIIGTQKFNFATKVPQMGDFQTQVLYFWKKIFRKPKI